MSFKIEEDTILSYLSLEYICIIQTFSKRIQGVSVFVLKTSKNIKFHNIVNFKPFWCVNIHFPDGKLKINKNTIAFNMHLEYEYSLSQFTSINKLETVYMIRKRLVWFLNCWVSLINDPQIYYRWNEPCNLFSKIT